MDKQEQSFFEFTAPPEDATKAAAQEQADNEHPIAGKVPSSPGGNAAHKLTAASGNSKPAKSESGDKTPLRPIALGKAVKQDSDAPAIKAKPLTILNKEKQDTADTSSSPAVVKESIETINEKQDDKTSSATPADGEKRADSAAEGEHKTGPTRKLPIPMGKQGIRLTEENIAQRAAQQPDADSQEEPAAEASAKNSTETDPTQKIEMPPPEGQPQFIESQPAAADSDDSALNTEKEPSENRVTTAKAARGSAATVKFGEKLRDARIAAGLSLADIEERTKIRKIYIEALEAEDFNRLPPMVYVCAYVKSLAALYGMDTTVSDEIVDSLKQLQPPHLSDATIQNMHIDCELDETEEHRLKLILTVGGVGIVLLVIFLSLFFWLRHNDRSRPEEATVANVTQPFNRSELEKLSPPQNLKMSILEPPPGGKR